MNPTKQQSEHLTNKIRAAITAANLRSPYPTDLLELVIVFLEKSRGHLPTEQAWEADRLRRREKRLPPPNQP